MESVRITDVTLRGLWGAKNVHFSPNPDVTILLGINGSGKTTVISIVNAVLTVNIQMLQAFSFEQARIRFRFGQRTRTVIVEKRRSEPDMEELIFRIGRARYVIRPDHYLRRRHHYFTRHDQPFPHPDLHEFLQSQLSKLIPVRWLSVHRATRAGDNEAASAVDAKLKSLIEDFRGYQLRLETRESQATTDFQHEVSKTILYDPELDDLANLQVLQRLDLQQEEVRFRAAFTELGISEAEADKYIPRHFSRLREMVHSFRTIEKASPGRHTPHIKAFFSIGLFFRTQKIITLAEQLQKRRTQIFSQFNNFIKLSNSFLAEKRLKLDKAGELQCLLIPKSSQDSKPPQTQPIAFTSLSSGEKQLLILLIETLIQDNEPCVFITDEPELSLHVEWQEKLLQSVRGLNPNAQIILATHSPDIVSTYQDKTIDMSDITTDAHAPNTQRH